MLKKFKSLGINSRLAASVAMALIIVGGTIYGGLAGADNYDQQIKALQQQNAANKTLSNQLAAQADSYQGAIYALQSQIDSLQQAIVTTQQKSNELQKQIDQAQADLIHEKQILGENIKTMYLEGKISTLEILASSKDLSEYINKQTYRNSVQNQVKTTLDKITALKQQLDKQQVELQTLIQQQQSEQSQLASQQAQQNNLLAYTEGQKSAYDSQIKAANSQIVALRAQQAADNRRLSSGGGVIAGDPGHGGYPAYLDYAYQDSLTDPWGMYNRECVSYTAWKVQQAYGYMPYWGGVGNANQWPGDAQHDSIPTGSEPKPGSVAIWNVGYYGHAMWVESVSGDGSIWVSQYNFDFTGHYSEMHVSAGMASSLTYIYFGQ